jgi:hypothetical protein
LICRDEISSIDDSKRQRGGLKRAGSMSSRAAGAVEREARKRRRTAKDLKMRNAG